MRVPAGKGRGNQLAKDLCEDFRQARNDAKEALLNENLQDYLMYNAQMRSMLELEIQEPNGEIFRMVSHLTSDEVMNPFGINKAEDEKISQWMSKRIAERGGLH